MGPAPRVRMTQGEFESRVEAILRRFAAQQGRPASSAEDGRRFAKQLAQIVDERGLPQQSQLLESRGAAALSETEISTLTARAIAGVSEEWLADVARQLVKACFYPELETCRDSFREVRSDGSCRRQELDRVRGRVSGTHCVDCPHWVALPPEQHRRFLQQEWKGDRATLECNPGVFLPEDFRALRQWIRSAPKNG